MSDSRVLTENYWIDRSRNKELYAEAKRKMPLYKRFFNELLGWRIIENEKIIKAEKIPAFAESFMGITEFTDIRDYCIFCALLIFMDDKEDYEQFLLSELVDFVEVQLKEYMDVDWTMFTQRKSLVRALQFTENMGMLKVYEGSSSDISSGMEHEVLYENTGLSRYFATNFGYGISEFESYRDFENLNSDSELSDRGHYRINRVYRMLASSPAMYWKDSDDQDSIYVKNQRQWIYKNLSERLGGNLHIHKNAAFFVMDEADCFGERHPADSVLSEIVLLICGEISDMVREGVLEKRNDDCAVISKEGFMKIVSECKEKYEAAWSKEYRQMDVVKIASSAAEYMEDWMLMKKNEDGWMVYPGAAKLRGMYPKDFNLERETENE